MRNASPQQCLSFTFWSFLNLVPSGVSMSSASPQAHRPCSCYLLKFPWLTSLASRLHMVKSERFQISFLTIIPNLPEQTSPCFFQYSLCTPTLSWTVSRRCYTFIWIPMFSFVVFLSCLSDEVPTTKLSSSSSHSRNTCYSISRYIEQFPIVFSKSSFCRRNRFNKMFSLISWEYVYLLIIH